MEITYRTTLNALSLEEKKEVVNAFRYMLRLTDGKLSPFLLADVVAPLFEGGIVPMDMDIMMDAFFRCTTSIYEEENVISREGYGRG